MEDQGLTAVELVRRLEARAEEAKTRLRKAILALVRIKETYAAMPPGTNVVLKAGCARLMYKVALEALDS